ncbi:MAG TPA: hypothetical protein VN643_18505 [Pyrinomonadaceae bacterium]|nr:hypothetical protein [Pyrinomonadaceae bacterium]
MGLSLTNAQIKALWDFAKQVTRLPVKCLSARIIGVEDLANRRKAEALLDALRQADWLAASNHQAIAGLNNLLLGVLLQAQTAGNAVSYYWAAMRSPFELLDSPEILAFGEVNRPPAGEWYPVTPPGF